MENFYSPGKYVNPMIDVAFKAIFASPKNKNLTKGLLEHVFDVKITDLSFINVGHIGETAEDRKAYFDVECESPEGDFIVEVQVRDQRHFADRALFYSTFPIANQAPSGDWDYSLKPVRFLGLLNFKLPTRSGSSDKFVHKYSILDEETHERMTDSVRYVFMEVGPFDKPLGECSTFEDRFLYFMRNLPTFADKPYTEDDQYFEELLSAAELAKMNKTMRYTYNRKIKEMRDAKNVEEFARQQAAEREEKLRQESAEREEKLRQESAEREEKLRQESAEREEKARESGIAEGVATANYDNALKMLEEGIDLALIRKITGLSEEDIKAL